MAGERPVLGGARAKNNGRSSAVRAIDLFAGAGGASLGLVAAGVTVVAAYERDTRAVRAHRALLPDVEVVVGDLADAFATSADLWWASPPCQPFSAAGLRRGARDERDGYPHLLRLLDIAERAGMPPRWLVIENVPGLLQHERASGCSSFWPRPNRCCACYLRDIEHQLDRWFPWVGTTVLDAADYGVPQHRERVFTVGGPRPITWPTPTHGPGWLPYVTSGDALGLRVFGGGTNPHGVDRAHERTVRELTDEPATVIAGDAGNNSLLAIEHGGARGGRYFVRLLDEPAPTVGTAGDLRLAVGGPNASDGKGPRVVGMNRPAPTVRAAADLYLVAAGLQPTGETCEGRARPLDRPAATVSGKGTMQLVRGADGGTYTRLRTLTVRERATLQALPWVPELTGRSVGNAVPPPLARAVAEAVLRADNT